MRALLSDVSDDEQHFVLMGSTHTLSVSEHIAINAKGYNPDFDFEKQIGLMYLFSAHMKQPVYYRLVNGKIAYYKLYVRLRQTKLLAKHSPKDIIEMSKAIYQMKIRGSWHRSEITGKIQKLFVKIGIDYLN